MDWQVKSGKLLKYLKCFLYAPIALMHVGLDADHIDLDPCFETAFDQNIVGRRNIEIIDQQSRRWIFSTRCLEQSFDQVDAPHFLAEARETVVIFVEDGHDDGFVDHIPHIDQPSEIRYIPLDARSLRLQDFSRAHRKKPIGCQRVPAKWMTFDKQAMVDAPAGSILQLFGHGLAALRFESC